MLRYAWRSLLGRKVRLVMSTSAIVLGVAFVVGTLIFSDTLNRSFTALFASSTGDVVVRPAGGAADDPGAAASSRATVPARLVEQLRGLPGVARVDGNVGSSGVYVVGRDGKAVGGFGPPALATNYTGAPSAAGPGLQVVSGHAPRGPDEIALDTSTADRAGYRLGDTVPVLTPQGRSRLTPTLVGLVSLGDGSSLNGASLVVFDTATAQRLFLHGRDAFTDLWVTAAGGVSQDQLAATVRPHVPHTDEVLTGAAVAQENAGVLKKALTFLTTFQLIFGGIALVVGSFLIVNTFSMLVAQRSRELALLRALGASRRQVARSVQLEALVLGLLGSTLGVGLGVLMAVGLKTAFATFGLDLSGRPLVIEPRTVVVAYVVGVAVTVVAAYLPARRSASIAPVQAMRDDVALPESSLRRRARAGLVLVVLGVAGLVVGLDTVVSLPGAGYYTGGGALAVLVGVTAAGPVVARPFLAAVASCYRRAFGSVGQLAGQNTRRNPRRTAATASALMIGLTLACTMAIIGASAKASISKLVDRDFVGDYVVTSVFGGTFNPGIGRQMARVEGVDHVYAVRAQTVRLEPDGGRGPEDVAAIDPSTLQGLGLPPLPLVPGLVLAGQRYATAAHLTPGSTVRVDAPRGPVTWRVAGIVPDNGLLGRPALITGTATVTRAGYSPGDSLLVIDVDPAAAGGPAAVQQRLQAVVADLPVVTVQDENAFADQQRQPVDRFVRIIYALLALALLIAVLGIVNTLALSVVERTREIGLLRAVGVDRGQLRRMITLESVAIAVLGAVQGVVLGVGYGVTLMYTVRDQGIDQVVVPVGQLAVFVVLGLVFGVAAAFLPARRASRLDVLAAIAAD